MVPGERTGDGRDYMLDWPTNARHELQRRARDRFVEKAPENGAGRTWRSCDRGEMAREAQRKIDDALENLGDDTDAAFDDLADAMNYVAFEADREIVEGSDRDG